MIDKLGLSTINWKIEKGKATDQFEEGSEEYYQNQLIRDFITMLIDKDTVNILHRSIDNDTKLLTDIVKELESSSSTREEPYGFYSLSTQTERKNDYITGKIGIGPFALNNNNHILTMLYGVRFKENPTSIMTILGLNNLASTEDAENNSIMSWISALINAHVDIAKDPYISKLNVNPYTYNLVNTLIRTGFGKNTFYFTTQPIMKDLARVYMNASSAYMSDSDKSIYALQKEATEKLAESLFKDEKIGESSYEDLLEVSDPNSIGARTIVNDIFKLLVDNGTIHRNANKSWDSITGATVKLNNKDLHLTPNQVQMIVYLANLEFAPYAQSVSNLVKYSKIDTKKHGKSYIEQLIFKEGFDDLFTDRDTGKLFEEEGIRDMARDSYIYTKTVNAIEMTKAILAGQFLQSTSAFDNARIKVLGMIGRTGSKDIDLNNKVVRMIMAAIKSEFINDYASNLRPDNPTYMRDLVSESEEELSYRLDAGSKTLKISGNKYPLTSYIGGNAEITFTAAKSDKMLIGFTTGVGVVVDRVDNENDATYTMRYPILGADDSTGEIITPFTRKLDSNGKIVITGGKNTIYDRFNRLLVQLKTDPEYRDVVDGSGEPINMLLRSMVRGKTYQYKPKHPSTNIFKEMPDTYDTLKFVKLFNALDLNGVISNYVIDGWDLLLHDNKEGHEELKRFAEDLVVYAFITSGDSNGFTKMFKLVPYTWRKESGYGEFIRGKIGDFQAQDINEEQLLDAILNNWFDNDIVRTYYSTHTSSVDGKSQIPNFIMYSGETAGRGLVPQYNPLIVAALKYNEETGKHEPSIDPNNAPMYIKIPRRNNQNGKNTQRRYTVYRKADYGMKQNEEGKWITYPIYVKVEPKGNQIEGNYLITEYGRSDAKNPEKTASTEALQKIYKIGDFISRTTVDDLKDKFGTGFADIVESLNYKHVLEDVYSGDLDKFDKAFNKQGEQEESSEQEQIPDLFEEVLQPGKNIQDSVDVLNAILNDNSVSKITKSVAEKYIKIFEKYPINIDFAGMGERGQWYANFNKTQKSFSELIVIPKVVTETKDSQYISEYVLHELTHAATSISINTNKDIENAFDAVIEHVKKIVELVSGEKIDWDNETKKKQWYGLSNANDFVAQVMSDVDFQGFLRTVPPIENDKFNNIFEKAIDLIKQAINKLLGNLNTTNLLDQIKPIVESLVNYQYSTKYESVKKALDIDKTMSENNLIVNNENNTEENRNSILRKLENHTIGVYKKKDKEIKVRLKLAILNKQNGTSFGAYVDDNLKIHIIGSIYNSPKKQIIDDMDDIYSLIYNEPSYDSAVAILQQNNIDIDSDESNVALGKLIKKLCKGE